jgi:hypothetical protein
MAFGTVSGYLEASGSFLAAHLTDHTDNDAYIGSTAPFAQNNSYNRADALATSTGNFSSSDFSNFSHFDLMGSAYAYAGYKSNADATASAALHIHSDTPFTIEVSLSGGITDVDHSQLGFALRIIGPGTLLANNVIGIGGSRQTSADANYSFDLSAGDYLVSATSFAAIASVSEDDPFKSAQSNFSGTVYAFPIPEPSSIIMVVGVLPVFMTRSRIVTRAARQVRGTRRGQF